MDNSLDYDSSGAQIEDQVYRVASTGNSDAQLDKTPLYSSALDPANCPLTATLFVLNEQTNVWENKSASTTPLGGIQHSHG